MKTKNFEQVIRKSLKEIKQYFKEKDTDESIDENETLILAGRNKNLKIPQLDFGIQSHMKHLRL